MRQILGLHGAGTRAPTHTRQRCGFSMAEIMISSVIILTLALLLLPAVKMVRNAALATKCAGNLRQFGMASDAYANDWEGGVVPSGYKVNGLAWYQSLAIYLGEDRIINDPKVGRVLRGCPIFRTVSYPTLVGGTWQWQQYNGYAETLYLANPNALPQNALGVYTKGCTYCDPTTPTFGLSPFNARSAVSKPSNRPFMFDHYGNFFNFLYSSTDPVQFQRHGQTANCLFFDLHVSPGTLKTLQAGSNLY